MGQEMTNRETVPGQDVAAGKQVTLRTKRIGAGGMSDYKETIIVKDFSMDDFMSQFHPTGNEYEQYLKQKE